MTGFDGPMMIARALASASSTSGVAGAAGPPRNSTSSTGPSPRALIMNSWNGHQRSWASTRVRTGLSLIGSTRARDAERTGDRGVGLGQPDAGVERAGALDADREIPVAEVEPHLDAESREGRP